MSEEEGLEQMLSCIGKQEAFIAGVMSGVVLGLESGFMERGVDCESIEAKERVKSLAKGLLETADDKLLLCASSALERLRDDLGCSICYDWIKTPISLQCGHSFCHSCIAKWTKAKPSCPVCRSPTLSYRSYSENVALRDLLKKLGVTPTEEEEKSTQQVLDNLRVEEQQELENAGDGVNPEILSQIRAFGSVRAQGMSRHPYQSEIRRSLRERARETARRQSVRQIYEDRLLREIHQRMAGQNPRRIQLLQQLDRVQLFRERERTTLSGLMDEIRSVMQRRAFIKNTFQKAAKNAASIAAERDIPNIWDDGEEKRQMNNTYTHRTLLQEIRNQRNKKRPNIRSPRLNRTNRNQLLDQINSLF